jgi:hypothetical protein
MHNWQSILKVQDIATTTISTTGSNIPTKPKRSEDCLKWLEELTKIFRDYGSSVDPVSPYILTPSHNRINPNQITEEEACRLKENAEKIPNQKTVKFDIYDVFDNKAFEIDFRIRPDIHLPIKFQNRVTFKLVRNWEDITDSKYGSEGWLSVSKQFDEIRINFVKKLAKHCNNKQMFDNFRDAYKKNSLFIVQLFYENYDEQFVYFTSQNFYEYFDNQGLWAY